MYPQANFAPDDLAVVVIDVGNIPSLPLQWYPEPDAGQPIGIAGFPSFRIEQAATLASVSPSAHFGRVNSRAYTADLIEFDALADHGNSGGPLFDEQNGVVFGVVTLGIQSKTSKAVQNNLAIKSSNVYLFLDLCYLPYVTFSPQNGHKRVVPCLDFPESYAAKASWCKEPDAVVRP